MNKIIKGALISSIIVVGFGISFHGLAVTPHDWSAVALWLPIYISPLWGIAGVSYLTERSKN